MPFTRKQQKIVEAKYKFYFPQYSSVIYNYIVDSAAFLSVSWKSYAKSQLQGLASPTKDPVKMNVYSFQEGQQNILQGTYMEISISKATGLLKAATLLWLHEPAIKFMTAFTVIKFKISRDLATLFGDMESRALSHILWAALYLWEWYRMGCLQVLNIHKNALVLFSTASESTTPPN